MDENKKQVEERFPGNSYNNISKKTEQKEQSDVPTQKKKKSKDITPTKTFGERLADSFLNVDPKSILEKFFDNSVVPWLKDSAEDLFHMFLHNGDSYSAGRRRRDSDGPRRRDYNSIYDGGRRRDRDDDDRILERQNFRRIRILIRDDRRKYAEQVIRDLIEEQDDRGGGWITVKDLYSHEYVDLPTNYVQSSWGWKDLYFEDVKFTRDSDGWIIEMPKAEVIG